MAGFGPRTSFRESRAIFLAATMQRLEATGYPVVLHVHDEVVVELPDGAGNVDAFKSLVEHLPEWTA